MIIRKLYITIFLFATAFLYSQDCKEMVVPDSLFKPSENKTIPVSAINVDLKNGGKIQLIDNNGKFILKLIMNEKFGYIDQGPLEIKSGNKSFFLKNTTLYDIKESSAYFLVDVLINYIGTLKDDGITSVVFNTKFEAKLSKEETIQIKKAAKCFYVLHKK